MVLEDPWGLPLREPSLSLNVEALGNSDMAARFYAELSALLPRERFVRVVAADAQTPQLQIRLRQQRQEMPVPGQFWSSPPTTLPRTRMEIQLEARLLSGLETEAAPLVLVQRGDAVAGDLRVLENQLLEALRHRLLQELQPRYRYR